MANRLDIVCAFDEMLSTMTMEELNEVECALLYLTRGDKAALQRIPEPRRSQVLKICRRKEGAA